MPRGLNGTHWELSLTGIVVPDIWRPPALAGPWGSILQRRRRSRPLPNVIPAKRCRASRRAGTHGAL